MGLGRGGERTAPGRPDAARGTADAETPRGGRRGRADDRVSRVCVCDTAERARPSPAVAHTPVPKGHCARARAISFFSFILYCVFSP